MKARAVVLSVVLGVAALVPGSARASVNEDVVAKLILALEQVATIVVATKTDCNVMGDQLAAYYLANQDFFTQAKALYNQIPPDELHAIFARYQARYAAAMSKVRMAEACMGNPKVRDVASRVKF
jgi:hypothetical protein